MHDDNTQDIYKIHIRNIQFLKAIMIAGACFLTMSAYVAASMIIEAFLKKPQNILESVSSVATGLFAFVYLVFVITMIQKIIKGIIQRSKIISRIRNGEISRDTFYIIKKDMRVNYDNRSIRPRRIDSLDFYINVVDQYNNQKTFYLPREIYDSVLQGDYVTIDYIDGYDHALNVVRRTP